MSARPGQFEPYRSLSHLSQHAVSLPTEEGNSTTVSFLSLYFSLAQEERRFSSHLELNEMFKATQGQQERKFHFCTIVLPNFSDLAKILAIINMCKLS